MRHSYTATFHAFEDVPSEDIRRSLASRVSPLAMPGTLAVAATVPTNCEDVEAFHHRFGVPMPDRPAFLNAEAFAYRYKFLREELGEFVEAHAKRDMETAFDSLLDLVYVALGTALMMGFTPERWQAGWDEVQRANMAKERARRDGGNSKRGTRLDVVKPAGWLAPDHSRTAGDGPWPTYAPHDAFDRELQFAPRSGFPQADFFLRDAPIGASSFEAVDRALASLPQDGPPVGRLEATIASEQANARAFAFGDGAVPESEGGHAD
jgi:predicted HAD superfamily Cof-like phosphohydrolase